jgi:hypothetical protein
MFCHELAHNASEGHDKTHESCMENLIIENIMNFMTIDFPSL